MIDYGFRAERSRKNLSRISTLITDAPYLLADLILPDFAFVPARKKSVKGYIYVNVGWHR